jgi:uncharacterized OsmC-like protein
LVSVAYKDFLRDGAGPAPATISLRQRLHDHLKGTVSMAIKAKTKVKTRMEATCPNHARSDISIRDLVVTIDEPVARGGTNLGASPTETTLASLIGCTNVIGHKCAARLGLDIGHLHITVVCDFDRRGVTLAEDIPVPFERIEMTVEADGNVSNADLARVNAEVTKYCPVSKLFRQAGTEIVETWRVRETS